jgi:hypothetical protein
VPVRTDTGAELVPAGARRQMLRVNFRTLSGDTPTLMLASCLRFCDDGALRGADNCIVARSSEGCWQVGGKLHREFECDGPVRVRLMMPGQKSPIELGPFSRVHTMAGVLYAEHNCLNILMPGRHPRRASDCIQLTLVWDGGKHVQA